MKRSSTSFGANRPGEYGARIIAPGHDVDRLTTALAGRYAVGECIGAGGTAFVYRATDLRHDRVVALKVLRSEVAASIERDRFLREIRILSGLTHPHILPLFDSGDSDGFLYYAMPLVEESLRDRLARETFLPVADTIRFAAEIGGALDFAHSRGIIHRDVKPANILIEDDHAVVADFGISKALGDASSDTSRSIAVGTPAYMSPEQADGESHIGGRSDVYALACVIYEMLAGSAPFAGPTPQAIQARKTHEPMPSLRSVRPTLEPALEAVLRRALAVVPADRFATAKDFVIALESPPKVRKSNTLPVALLTSVGVAAVLAGVAYLSYRRAPAGSPTVTRVAVAEFVNHTGDTTLKSIGFMALDYVTEGLQRLSSLSVVPASAAVEASRVSGENDHAWPSNVPPDFQRETGADLILSGGYYRSGDSLSFQARVTDARDQRVIIAIGPVMAPTARPELALAQIRTRAMGYFATKSDDRLAGPDEAKDAPPTYEAYADFSAGMTAYIHSRHSIAAQSFSKAIAEDSTFPTPRLFLSLSLSNLKRYAEADSVAQALARALARTPGQLNPYYQDWLDYRLALLAADRPKALVAVRRLAKRVPGTKATFNYAVEAQENGRYDEALHAIESLPADRGAMRGWAPYWDELGAAHHLEGDYRGELAAGLKARAMYSDRLYALVPSVRSLAALHRVGELTSLLTDAAQIKDDTSGTTLGSLFREAGEELLAHDDPTDANAMFARGAQWYQTRLASSRASRRDSLAAANLLYEGGRSSEAAALLSGRAPDVETIALAGLIAARLHHVDEARAAMARLDADKRPYQFGAPQVARARIAASLGDSTTALAALHEAFASGKEYGVWIHRTAELAPLRANADFIALVRPRQ